MASLRELENDLEIIKSIQGLATSYQEIATLEMNRIKETVLKTRKFLDGVAQVYNHAKSAYISQFRVKNEQEKEILLKQFPFIKRNGKKILVFLSANERFYGGLILNIFNEISKDLKKGYDLAVVGEIGKRLIQRANISNKTFFFYLDDDHPTEHQIRAIFKTISQYEKIVVYHGEFETAVLQKPAKTDISGGITLEEEPRETRQYLFEPSPEAIMEFFEKEIINSLFHQSIFEHQLAKFASRLITMYQAKENAKKLTKKLNQKFKNIKREIENKKQLSTISSFRLWEEI